MTLISGWIFEDDIFAESLFFFFFSQLAHAHENLLAIKMDGITKEEFAWGFRVGFVTYGYQAAAANSIKLWKIKRRAPSEGTYQNAPESAQSLLLNAMQSETHSKEKERNKAVLKSRY